MSTQLFLCLSSNKHIFHEVTARIVTLGKIFNDEKPMKGLFSYNIFDTMTYKKCFFGVPSILTRDCSF